MNGKYLLDTNIVLGLLYRQPEVIRLVPAFRNGDLYCSVITKLELLSWHSLTQTDEIAVRGILETLRILPLSQTIEELAILFRRATRLKLPDSIIAASAISVHATLVSCYKVLADALYPELHTLNPLTETC